VRASVRTESDYPEKWRVGVARLRLAKAMNFTAKGFGGPKIPLGGCPQRSGRT